MQENDSTLLEGKPRRAVFYTGILEQGPRNSALFRQLQRQHATQDTEEMPPLARAPACVCAQAIIAQGVSLEAVRQTVTATLPLAADQVPDLVGHRAAK